MLIAIPVTLALTLFMFYLYGYTLNRITLFALIFSIGILVDDAIVVVENIVRHAQLTHGEPDGLAAVALRAVDEVGNPTILATLAVVAADSADGLRRRPDGPVHAPDSGRRVGGDGLLAGRRLRRDTVGGGAAAEARPAHHDHGEEDLLHAALSARDGPAHRERPRCARLFLAGVAVLLLARRSRSCRSSW